MKERRYVSRLLVILLVNERRHKKMKSKYTKEAVEQFHKAIRNDDLDTIRELINQDKVAITNIECIMTVQENKLRILSYFLRTTTNIIGALSYALNEAIRQKNYDALKLMIIYFKENKYCYPEITLNSVIVDAIREVTRCETNNVFDSETALDMITFIALYYRD